MWDRRFRLSISGVRVGMTGSSLCFFGIEYCVVGQSRRFRFSAFTNAGPETPA